MAEVVVSDDLDCSHGTVNPAEATDHATSYSRSDGKSHSCASHLLLALQDRVPVEEVPKFCLDLYLAGQHVTFAAEHDVAAEAEVGVLIPEMQETKLLDGTDTFDCFLASMLLADCN